MISALLDRLKPEEDTFILLPVKCSDVRNTVLSGIEAAKKPRVLVNSRTVTDYSERGAIGSERLATVRDLEIRDGNRPVLGFHGGPAKMWVSADYRPLVAECRAKGWIE